MNKKKKEKKLDEYERALEAFAAPAKFALERIEILDGFNVLCKGYTGLNGNTRVFSVPTLDMNAAVSLANHLRDHYPNRFEFVVVVQNYSHYDGTPTTIKIILWW